MGIKEPRVRKPQAKQGPTFLSALGLHGGHARSLQAMFRINARKSSLARKALRRRKIPAKKQ